MARFIVGWCVVVGACWLAWSAPVSGLSDVIEYRLVEGQPANALVGNVPVDAGLHTMYTAQTLTSFRYRLLPTDGDQEPSSQSVMFFAKIIYTVDHRRCCTDGKNKVIIEGSYLRSHRPL